MSKNKNSGKSKGIDLAPLTGELARVKDEASNALTSPVSVSGTASVGEGGVLQDIHITHSDPVIETDESLKDPSPEAQAPERVVIPETSEPSPAPLVFASPSSIGPVQINKGTVREAQRLLINELNEWRAFYATAQTRGWSHAYETHGESLRHAISQTETLA